MTDSPLDPIVHCEKMIEGWLPGAMFPSEIAWFLRGFRAMKADLLIECGRQDGVSTAAFGSYFKGTGVKIVSIDFDSDPNRARRAAERVAAFEVELVTGDIHVQVPKIVQAHPNRRIAILQDGPKGWEGLATLLAASQSPNVILAAQHNLHLGHCSRTLFQHIAIHPAFLEYAQSAGDFAAILQKERIEIAKLAPNRPIDHTSLGLLRLDPPQRAFVLDSFNSLRRDYGPWNPLKVLAAWGRQDFSYVSRLHDKSRYTMARFKKR